ncbi:cytochrome C [Methylobacterium durans]|uniref:c-type cytochrome n=1 Tax=Methylobacterium durans TaxID=2202825 RepID=UPI002AFF7ADF|nr:cytochrome C [Methylobacterium durans]MEA1833647.1 cytochrome C [Methylobacterium durans]
MTGSASPHRARVTLLAAGLLAASPAVAETRAPPGATACLGCHDACPDDPTAPPCLRRLKPDAIAEALEAFRANGRAGTVMPLIAKGFSREEIRALASYLGRPEGSPR